MDQTIDICATLYRSISQDFVPKAAAVLAAYLVLKFVQFLFERKQLHETFKRMKVPHTKPHLISGDLFDMRRVPFVKFAHKLHEKHGKNVGYFMGGDPFLATKDLELIQQVFVAKSRLFYDRMPFYLNIDPVPDNLICQRGDRWRYMRKLLTPAFTNSKIKSSQFYWDSQKTFEKIRNQIDKNSKTIAIKQHQDGHEMMGSRRVTLVEDVYDRMAAVALDMICKTAFHMDNMISFDGPVQFGANFSFGKRSTWLVGQSDSNSNNNNRKEDKFLDTVKRAIHLAFNPLIQLIVCFPFLDPILTFICSQFVFASIFKLLLDRLNYLVRRSETNTTTDRENSVALSGNPTELAPSVTGEQKEIAQRKRIIDSLLEVLRERKITRSEFTGNALVIVFAGFETTANAFTFTLWLLAKNPEVQTKLRKELLTKMAEVREKHKSSERAADQADLLESELNELATGCEYLENVINESLRLYPPVPALTCRRASTDFQLSNGIKIEKGVSVIPSVWSIHRDKEIWGEQANEFRPERFEVLDVTQVNSAMFMPFGFGPRNCIGKAVAMHEIKIIIGRMVLEYSIEQCPKLTPEKLKICSPINITITNSERIALNFVKL